MNNPAKLLGFIWRNFSPVNAQSQALVLPPGPLNGFQSGSEVFGKTLELLPVADRGGFNKDEARSADLQSVVAGVNQVRHADAHLQVGALPAADNTHKQASLFAERQETVPHRRGQLDLVRTIFKRHQRAIEI